MPARLERPTKTLSFQMPMSVCLPSPMAWADTRLARSRRVWQSKRSAGSSDGPPPTLISPGHMASTAACRTTATVCGRPSIWPTAAFSAPPKATTITAAWGRRSWACSPTDRVWPLATWATAACICCGAGPRHRAGRSLRGRAMSQGSTARIGVERLGRYQLLERIGGGATSVVYAAHDDAMDRRVAVKMIVAELEDERETRERFYREAK